MNILKKRHMINRIHKKQFQTNFPCCIGYVDLNEEVVLKHVVLKHIVFPHFSMILDKVSHTVFVDKVEKNVEQLLSYLVHSWINNQSQMYLCYPGRRSL